MNRNRSAATAVWWQWAALVGLGALGALAFLFTVGGKAALSYLAAELLAALVFTVTIAAVRWAAQISPSASMMVAVTTYVTVIGIFAALLARLDSSVVYPPAFAAGLVVAVVVWIAQLLHGSRPGKSD